MKRIPYARCCKCGLLLMNNPFTAWAIKKGCNHDDHPDLKQMRYKYTSKNK